MTLFTPKQPLCLQLKLEADESGQKPDNLLQKIKEYDANLDKATKLLLKPILPEHLPSSHIAAVAAAVPSKALVVEEDGSEEEDDESDDDEAERKAKEEAERRKEEERLRKVGWGVCGNSIMLIRNDQHQNIIYVDMLLGSS